MGWSCRGRVKTNYPGGERGEKDRKNAQQEVMRALIDEGEMDLAKQDFQEEALEYIIAHYAE